MKRNILFLSHSAQVGGAELCLLDLLGGLQGYRGRVLIPCDGPLKKRIEATGWKVSIYPVPWWITFYSRNRRQLQDFLVDLPKRLGYLHKIIIDDNIQMIYTNSIACIDGALAAKIWHLPHVWHIHEALDIQKDLKFYIPKSLLPFLVNCLSEKVIVPSRNTGRFIAGHLKNNVQAIYNGIDLDRFGIDRAGGFRLRAGIPADVKVVSIIGSINENKRQTDFIEAAKIVTDKVAGVFFLIVGRGNSSYTDMLREKIDTFDLRNKFAIMDARDDVPEILASSNIIVSASVAEGFGRILVEAMASGKPVVSTRNGGSEEIVEDGKTGLLVSSGSPCELAEAVLTLLKNESLAHKMGESGRKRAEQYFSVEDYVHNIRDVLASIP